MKIIARFEPESRYPIKLYVEGEPNDFTVDEARDVWRQLGDAIGEADAHYAHERNRERWPEGT